MHVSLKEIDGLIRRFSPFTRPGSSILIAQKGKILFSRGYGVADIEAETPAAADTTYLIASVSKQFACAAAMHLAEAGKLALDDPIARYLPLFPAFGDKVTIRHLMTHTSGIPEYFTPEFRRAYCKNESPDLDLAGLLKLIADRYQSLESVPGSSWSYCNTGYVILEEIVRRAADMPYAAYLHDHFFSPLGMTHTRVGNSDVRPAGMAKGYHRNRAGQLVPSPYNRAVVGWADGSVISNGPDLFTWLDTIHHKGILSPASWQQILTPSPLNNGDTSHYGLGWFFSDRLGLKERWHTGSTIGYHCRVSWFDREETAVIWLCNSDADSARDINIPLGHLISHVLGREMTPMPGWHAMPAPLADLWTGTWVNGPGGDAGEQTTFTIVQLNDGRLTLEGELKGASGSWPLLPRSDHACWIDSGAHYFLEMETGKAADPMLLLHFHGSTLAFEREQGR